MLFEDSFSERLAHLREKKGISAREMSLAIGQNESYINRIENKKAFPSMQSFFYICEYLKISPKDFFDFNSDDPHYMSELLSLLKRLTPEQLDTIQHVAQQFIQRT